MNCPICNNELRKTGKTVTGWEKIPVGEGVEIYTCLNKKCKNFKKALIIDPETDQPKRIK